MTLMRPLLLESLVPLDPGDPHLLQERGPVQKLLIARLLHAEGPKARLPAQPADGVLRVDLHHRAIITRARAVVIATTRVLARERKVLDTEKAKDAAKVNITSRRRFLGVRLIDSQRPPTIPRQITRDGNAEAFGIQIYKASTFASFVSVDLSGLHCTACPPGSRVSSYTLACLLRFISPAMSCCISTRVASLWWTSINVRASRGHTQCD